MRSGQAGAADRRRLVDERLPSRALSAAEHEFPPRMGLASTAGGGPFAVRAADGFPGGVCADPAKSTRSGFTCACGRATTERSTAGRTHAISPGSAEWGEATPPLNHRAPGRDRNAEALRDAQRLLLTNPSGSSTPASATATGSSGWRWKRPVWLCFFDRLWLLPLPGTAGFSSVPG